MFKCRFLKINENAKLPFRSTHRSSGMDIWPLEPFRIQAGEFKLVGTGLVAIPPLGFHYELVLRSSTPKKYPGLILANHIGIIDSDYVGEEDEIKIALYNTSIESHYVTLDKPLAQLLLRENVHFEIEEMSLEEYRHYGFKSRGGFGSTDFLKKEEK